MLIISLVEDHSVSLRKNNCHFLIKDMTFREEMVLTDGRINKLTTTKVEA